MSKLIRYIFFPDDISDNGQNTKTHCLWCGKHACEISNEVPHQFQCWSCKKTGNGYTLLQEYHNTLPPLSDSDKDEWSKKKPGIDPVYYDHFEVKLSQRGLVWPVKNREGKVVALYRYDEEHKHFVSTPKPFSLSILGLEDLKNDGPVWILEGHWDYAAFLTHTTTSDNIIAVCGSSYPTRHLDLMENREVYFLGDNDEAGRLGAASLATRMKKVSMLPASLRYLDWTSVTVPNHPTVPEKFDIRDLCVELTK